MFGLLGVGVGLGALFPTALTLFFFGLALDCNGPSTPRDVAGGVLFGAGWSVAFSVPWLLAVSLLRVSAGRSGLRWRTWVLVGAGIAVLAAVYLGIALALRPPPSDTCQPFQMD